MTRVGEKVRTDWRRARERRFRLWKRWKAGTRQRVLAAELGVTVGRISVMLQQFDREFVAATKGEYGWACHADIVNYETEKSYGKWFPSDPVTDTQKWHWR